MQFCLASARTWCVLAVSLLLVPLSGLSVAFAGEPEDKCPEGADGLSVVYRVDGVEVSSLQDNVAPGSAVEVDVTVPEGCEVELTPRVVRGDQRAVLRRPGPLRP